MFGVHRSKRQFDMILQHLVRVRRTMFQVTDTNGKPLAQYANESEAQTYCNASFPGCTLGTLDDIREGEIPVFNADGDEIAAIRVPSEPGAEHAAQPRTGNGEGRGGSAAKGGKGKAKGSGK